MVWYQSKVLHTPALKANRNPRNGCPSGNQEEASGQERQAREIRGRISSSLCSPALLLCVNSGGGLCLSLQ